MPKRAAGARASVALGTMNFGKRTDAAESERIVRRAIERGIGVFDTANVYNAGESERILGRALGRDRERVVVASKVGIDRVDGKREGLSPEAIKRAIDATLARLGTTCVDVYYLHAPDHDTPIERTVGAMTALVDAGKVRAWGVSNYASWQILEMHAMTRVRPVVSQVLYNVLHRELDIEHFAYARRHPIHVTVYNPLAGGLLSGKHSYAPTPPAGSRFDDNAMYQRRYWTRAMFDRVERLREVARGEGCTLVDLAYAWVASREGVDSILVGPASVRQLDVALEACGRRLSTETLARIDELSREWAGTDTHYVR